MRSQVIQFSVYWCYISGRSLLDLGTFGIACNSDVNHVVTENLYYLVCCEYEQAYFVVNCS